jgi:hypothetical protein
LSTILKALRRLEEEKAAAEEPRPLREQIASTPLANERPRRRGWLGATVALVLGVAAGGSLIWGLFRGSSESVEVAAAMPEPAVATAEPAPVVRPALTVPEPAPAAGPPEQAFESDVEIVERPDPLPRLVDSEPIAPGQTDPVPGSRRPVESSAAMERARRAARAEYAAAERARRGLPPEVVAPATAPPEPAVEPVAPTPAEPQPTKIVAVAPEILAPAPAAAPEPPPGPEPVPEAKPAPPPEPPVREAAVPKPAPEPVREAPAPPPADLPPFAIEKTQWHPLADRRVAWLRMPGESEPRRVVEGDVVDGLLVAKIEPSGVVFERDGKKIQRMLGQR